MKTKAKVLWSAAGAVVLLGLAGAVLVWKTRGPVIREIVQDLKAGAMARHAEVPFDRFMEIRFGSMDEPANRQRAFLSFFDSTHIEGLHRLTTYMKPGERQSNIVATVRWIERYRENMPAAERESLRAILQTDQGRSLLGAATSKYLSQDAHYRAATAPVIAELMVTLNRIQQNQGSKP